MRRAANGTVDCLSAIVYMEDSKIGPGLNVFWIFLFGMGCAVGVVLAVPDTAHRDIVEVFYGEERRSGGVTAGRLLLSTQRVTPISHSTR